MTARKLPKAFFRRLTDKQKIEIWHRIESLALKVASSNQALLVAKDSIQELLKLVKKLERAEIGDLLSNKD